MRPTTTHTTNSLHAFSAYRFHFNGKETDNEVYGEGNALDFGARIYDSRLGRWLSVDPLQTSYPSLCPYNYTANNPIVFIDLGGKSIKPGGQNSESVIKEAIAPYINGGLFTVTLITFQDRDGNITQILKTFTSNNDFKKALKESGLNRDERKIAKAYFNLLKSKDVYEITIVSKNSTRKDDHQAGSTPYAGATVNPNLDNLSTDLKNEKDPIKRAIQLDANLKTGDVSGENFGYFEDKVQDNNPIQGSLIVTNSSNTSTDLTFKEGDKKMDNSTLIKTLNNAVKTLDKMKVGNQPD